MKTRQWIVAVLCGLIFACTPQQEEEKKTYNLSGLEIVPHPDTLFLNVNDARLLNLRGSSLSISERTMSNTGIMTGVSYTVRSVDTVTQSIPSSDATWSSSNPNVASVSQGTITGRGAGMATISAVVGNVPAQGVLVNVKTVNTAPGLLLDPPSYSITFQNFVKVTGVVQVPATLEIAEPVSGFDDTNVPFTTDGVFSETVTGLVKGLRTITAVARNVNNPALATTKQKLVLYYPYLGAEADSICGAWVGTTVGRNFNFNIQKNALLLRYDITGHIDIQFDGIGVIRDIELTGIIDKDGTINAVLPQKSYENFSVSGSFTGHFKTVGTGDGNYRASAQKSGWPKLSGDADWTAVKTP